MAGASPAARRHWLAALCAPAHWSRRPLNAFRLAAAARPGIRVRWPQSGSARSLRPGGRSPSLTSSTRQVTLRFAPAGPLRCPPRRGPLPAAGRAAPRRSPRPGWRLPNSEPLSGRPGAAGRACALRGGGARCRIVSRGGTRRCPRAPAGGAGRRRGCPLSGRPLHAAASGPPGVPGSGWLPLELEVRVPRRARPLPAAPCGGRLSPPGPAGAGLGSCRRCGSVCGRASRPRCRLGEGLSCGEGPQDGGRGAALGRPLVSRVAACGAGWPSPAGAAVRCPRGAACR